MVPDLRPRGIGEMLDAAVALYRARFRRLMFVALAVVVPVQVLSTLVLLSAQPDSFSVSFTGSATPQYDNRSAAVQLGATVVVLIVNLLSTAFVVAVCTRIVADAYIDHGAAPDEAVRVAGRRIFAIIGLSLIVAVSQVIGFFFCLVGALVPIGFFSVAVPALILEGVGVTSALGRSWNLVKAHFFRALGLVLAAQVLGAVVNVGLSAAVGLLERNSDNTTAAVIGQGIASAVAATLTTPFLATATVVLYFDLRIRNEAYDVQLLMQRNDTRYAQASV
jgi:hypothetical protein